MYEAEGLNTLLKKCHAEGVICIADEVMTGFGRTGKLFASAYMEEQPDIICLSKGLTGGTMALGVTACTHRVYEAFLQEDAMKTFFHGHSFTANPLACAASWPAWTYWKKKAASTVLNALAGSTVILPLCWLRISRLLPKTSARSVRSLPLSWYRVKMNTSIVLVKRSPKKRWPKGFTYGHWAIPFT